MKFKHSVPILFSSSVTKSLAYYTEVLGFDDKWQWDDPPTFGGVSKNGIEIFFCENGQGHPGTWLAIMIENVDEYHEAIRERGARIARSPTDMEWGLREMLVQDLDGHVIRFGQSISMRKNSEPAMPSTIRIVRRLPTIREYRSLVLSVGWNVSADDGIIEKILAAPLFSVVAEDIENQGAVGCALLLGDLASFYYVKDVMVHPQWQNKRIGTAMMQELSHWLNKEAPDNSLVGLYTGENLTRFYRQFDFNSSYAMTRRIKRKGNG